MWHLLNGLHVLTSLCAVLIHRNSYFNLRKSECKGHVTLKEELTETGAGPADLGVALMRGRLTTMIHT